MPDQYSQMISPVLALSAKTSSLPVTTYMMPSLTSGDASNEYLPPTPEPFRRVIHAPLSLPDIGGVDLLQRRIAIIGEVAAVGNPVLADRASKQAVDLGIGGSGGRCAMINRPKTINVETVHHARRSITASPIFMLAFGQSMSAYSRPTDLARPFEGVRTAFDECRHIASFRCGTEFGRYRGIVKTDQARFMRTFPKSGGSQTRSPLFVPAPETRRQATPGNLPAPPD